MSSQAAVIRVAESLIPLPPEAFPKNLSRTAREDSPESMFPILAYDGQNILPTPWGYRSYFATNEKLLKDAVARLLSNVRCENIFWYQSVQLDNVLVALASDGIYITNTDIDTAWIKVVNLSAADTDPLVRKQWSFCTINNITFMYLQGTGSFYGLVDSARYAEAATPTIITGATVSQVATHWNVGVLSYTPTFLNMAGQLGIFKAGNRLGFWDSDASVSWSSALYVEDFTPSVTTLAGFSKFADVIGSITRICQHGDGFIIYATRSIVGVSNNVNEKSKFSGRALLSNSGVLFDRQIAVAQPDSLHYALTSSGLYTITNFQPEVIATDIIDGLVEANDYLCLDYIDGRYLFINTINGWQSSIIDFEGTTGIDVEGNEFTLPAVNYPNPENAKDLLDSYLNGRNELIQDALKDFIPDDDPVVRPDEGKALLPCYDIRTFTSTWAGLTFTPNPTGTELLDSKLKLGITYLLEDIYVDPVVTVNALDTDNQLPGNFAGQEAFDKLNLGMIAFNNQMTYQNAWATANSEIDEVLKFTPSFDPPPGYDGSPISIPWERNLIERITRPYCISPLDLEATATECRLELYLNKTRLAELLVYFEGTETYAAGKMAFFLPGITLSDFVYENYTNAPTLDKPKSYIAVPFSAEIIAEFKTEWAAVRGTSYIGEPYSSGQIIDATYVSFCLAQYPELVDCFGMSKINIQTLIQATYEQSLLDSSLYNIPTTVKINGYWAVSGAYYDIGAWYELIDGGSFVANTSNAAWATDGSPSTGWGPYTFGGGESYFQLGSFLISDTWSTEETNAIKSEYTGQPGYTLEGTITREFDLLPNFDEKIIVYALELSGFGYYPSGGFSFRKTHSRSSSTSCPMPLTGWPSSLPTGPGIEFPDYDIDSEITPPYKWEYPDSIPLPPNYWLTKKGSASPLYPTFIRSLIYDTQLEKWGISNMNFKAICAISPVNRTDDTIAPKHDYGMLAAILAPDGSVSVLRPNNPQGEICYGKIGQYRLGKTRMAYLKCHFKDKFTGTLIVETSLDGRTVAPELTKAADFTDIVAAKFPFTMVGEWFNIKIRGDFALSHIECFIEGRSRR